MIITTSIFSYFGIPYSHDMCPCKTCFPNNEPCIRGCNKDYVSCPLIQVDINDNNITSMSHNDTNVDIHALENLDSKKFVHILQQPTNLPMLTDLYNKKAIEFMQTNAHLNKPFFLYMAYHQTHHPQFAGFDFSIT